MDIPWESPLAGLLVGVLVGTTGVGGGSLMTPLLVLMIGVSPQTAVGTDLLYASVTKLFGVSVHSFAKRVDWQIVGRLALGSLPTALVTLLWLGGQEKGALREGMIITALGIMLLLTAIAMAAMPWMVRRRAAEERADPVSASRLQPIGTIASGAALGVLVTLTSIGAGALGAVMLLFLYPVRLTPARLVATDLAHAIPLALLAGAGHLLMGHVDFALLGWLLLGSIPGVWFGAHFAGKLPDRVLRFGIAGVLGLVGVRLLA
jgi:uncharacterized membrane protein YfcA